MVLKLKALFLFTQMGQQAGRCWDRGCVCLEEDLPNKLEMPGGLGGKGWGQRILLPRQLWWSGCMGRRVLVGRQS